MTTRGGIFLAALAVAALGVVEPQPKALEGLHHQDWYHASFGILAEDLAEATAAGKRLAVVWEQIGCAPCAQMHEVNFRDPNIVEFIKANFFIVQLDFRGDRTVTDFDGQVMSEKELARKHRVNTTPVIQFFPETAEAIKGKRGTDAEVARMPGLYKPDMFLALFRYVHERRYQTEDFASYLRARKKSAS
ncbi:MAG: thioredoxin family protein [Rhodospirillales bacterium]|nr:thioredoxin family protein [Rhodospirillales bacterium]